MSVDFISPRDFIAEHPEHELADDAIQAATCEQ